MLPSRSLLFVVLTLLFYTPKGICQKVYDPKDYLLTNERKFSDENIDQLKNTQTVFFYPGSIRAQLDTLKRVVSESWDLTPIIFDEISNYSNYLDPKYSWFNIEAIFNAKTSVQFILVLRLITEITKKEKVKTIGLSRVDLFPKTSSLEKKAKGWGTEWKTMEEIYEDGIFYNFTPLLIKAQLQAVAGNLTNKIRPKKSEAIKAENLSQLLANDTLYVPTSLIVGYDPFSWKDKAKKDNVFENYRYKYRLCTDAELYQIFEIEHRGRLLFEYVKSSADKFITIYDLKDKKPIYRHHTEGSYNLKSKDIERLE